MSRGDNEADERKTTPGPSVKANGQMFPPAAGATFNARIVIPVAETSRRIMRKPVPR